jgi:hypothetical protein
MHGYCLRWTRLEAHADPVILRWVLRGFADAQAWREFKRAGGTGRGGLRERDRIIPQAQAEVRARRSPLPGQRRGARAAHEASRRGAGLDRGDERQSGMGPGRASGSRPSRLLWPRRCHHCPFGIMNERFPERALAHALQPGGY